MDVCSRVGYFVKSEKTLKEGVGKNLQTESLDIPPSTKYEGRGTLHPSVVSSPKKETRPSFLIRHHSRFPPFFLRKHVTRDGEIRVDETDDISSPFTA